jgi:hypothetical protein
MGIQIRPGSISLKSGIPMKLPDKKTLRKNHPFVLLFVPDNYVKITVNMPHI